MRSLSEIIQEPGFNHILLAPGFLIKDMFHFISLCIFFVSSPNANSSYSYRFFYSAIFQLLGNHIYTVKPVSIGCSLFTYSFTLIQSLQTSSECVSDKSQHKQKQSEQREWFMMSDVYWLRERGLCPDLLLAFRGACIHLRRCCKSDGKWTWDRQRHAGKTLTVFSVMADISLSQDKTERQLLSSLLWLHASEVQLCHVLKKVMFYGFIGFMLLWCSL